VPIIISVSSGKTVANGTGVLVEADDDDPVKENPEEVEVCVGLSTEVSSELGDEVSAGTGSPSFVRFPGSELRFSKGV